MDRDDIATIEGRLGYEFDDPSLLEQALTHASVVDSRLESNERLEFLGDSILGMIVCAYLHEQYDDLLEGEMTKIKSTVVSGQSCATIGEQLGLDQLIRLGKGMANRATLPISVTAAAYEAIVGAIFLDGGIDAARDFVLRDMTERIEEANRSGHQFNFKSVLQQALQQEMAATPQYVILDEKGPDHAKCFEVCVDIGARRFNSCWEPSKKQAEQHAALEALIALGWAERLDSGEVRLLDPNGRES